MNFWKELRTRWMYWRYRNITRNRQRLQLKWAARRSRNPVYMAPSGRGIRPVRSRMTTGIGRSWLLLILVSIALAILRYYGDQGNLDTGYVFLGSIAVLALGYLIWLKTG